MPVRRLAAAIALMLFVMPASQALAGRKSSGPRPLESHDQPASRADVLAGRASDEQRADLLRSSIEAAGGVAVRQTDEEAASASPSGLGGYAYPLLAADLDGDGDDEILLEQYAHREYLVAIDNDDVLWRLEQPPHSELIGALPGDLFAGGGDEVLLVLYRWKTHKVVLGGAGTSGLRWSAPFEAYYTELNGLVQGDSDEQSEIALSVWGEEDGDFTIQTIDGEMGSALATIHSTPDDLLDASFSSEGFVTDGPAGQPDEAVFVTPLAGGYYAERRSLTDGMQTDVQIVPDTDSHTLVQGPDYTGDGRRDAYISDVFGPPTLDARIGVFDAAGLETAWTQTPEDGAFAFYPALQLGDSNGDGGQDVCFFRSQSTYDQEQDRVIDSTSKFTCYAGATGVKLWDASLTITPPEDTNGYTWGNAVSDLNGDAVTDPVLYAQTYRCNDEELSCEVTFEAVAHSGKDGSVLWRVTDPNQYGLQYDLTGADLDGIAGDDILEYAGGEPSFDVRNGLSLTHSWRGALDSSATEAYPEGALAADIDGDGTSEAVVFLSAYEGIGEPECYVYDGEEYCYFEDYEEYAYVGAFEPGGDLLWQLEL